MLLGSSPPPTVFITLMTSNSTNHSNANFTSDCKGHLTLTNGATCNPSALDVVGSKQKHCVGNGRYTASFGDSNPSADVSSRRSGGWNVGHCRREALAAADGIVTTTNRQNRVKAVSRLLRQLNLADFSSTAALNVGSGDGAVLLSELPGARNSKSTPDLISYLHAGSDSKGASKRPTKRVVFADDRGLQLVTIRIMSEPSDVPPLLRRDTVDILGCGQVTFFAGKDRYDTVDSVFSNQNGCQNMPPKFTWSLNFKQPASDYLAFRQKVDSQNVALENVIIKNDQRRVRGTVRVKNLAYDKFVFLRVTFDQWATSADYPCTYKSPKYSGGCSLSTNQQTNSRCDLFDTFEFDVELWNEQNESQRRLAEKAEFCVCYTVNNAQFWDSDNGKNFQLLNDNCNFYRGVENGGVSCVSSAHPMNETSKIDQSADDWLAQKQNGKTSLSRRLRLKKFSNFQAENCGSGAAVDAFTMNMANWTQFASWKHLSTDGPYW